MSHGPTALWYLTRGTGVVCLLLLTTSVALGVAHSRGARGGQAPRFVVEAVHRSASLMALAFLLVHVITSVLDAFAPIRLVDAVIPFISSYRPIWLGLGAVASDLLIALVLTSLLRRHLGLRAWRAIHWLAYACWPVALVHGFGTGSDAKTTWMLILSAACVLAVLVAVWLRASAAWPQHAGACVSAVLASIAAPGALLVWLPSGPLGANWARRAGTPAALLGAPRAAGASGVSRSSRASTAVPTAFTASLSGTLAQAQLSGGPVQIDLRLSVNGEALSTFEVRIIGEPSDGGGVGMTSSAVTLGTSSDHGLYRGQVTALEGTNVAARVRGPGGELSLVAQLQIDEASGAVTGTLTSHPA